MRLSAMSSKTLTHIYKTTGHCPKRLQDSILREGETRRSDLLLRIFMSIRQPGESPDPHYQEGVPLVQVNNGGFLGYLYPESEPLPRGSDS